MPAAYFGAVGHSNPMGLRFRLSLQACTARHKWRLSGKHSGSIPKIKHAQVEYAQKKVARPMFAHLHPAQLIPAQQKAAHHKLAQVLYFYEKMLRALLLICVGHQVLVSMLRQQWPFSPWSFGTPFCYAGLPLGL
jgi:hypothetical protein